MDTPELQARRAAGPPIPHVSGMGAQRAMKRAGLLLAPALTAGAIAYGGAGSAWEGLLVFACVLAVAALLRSPDYPLHLVPFSSAALYALAPPVGALLAAAFASLEGSAATQISLADLGPPVVGAWLVTLAGALIYRRFESHRQVRIAVIGSREFTRGLMAELAGVKIRGYRVVGFFDPGDASDVPDAELSRLGSLQDLRAGVIAERIDLLVLGPLTPASAEPAEGRFQARGVSRLEVFETVADACLDLSVSLIEAGQLYEELFGHVPLGTTTSAWFQYLLHPRYRGSSPASKRALDLLLGSIAALFAIVPVAIGALAIRLTDPGPIFHRQVRIGEGGREIELAKLRTMRETKAGPSWTEDDDKRITPVGRVLRRLHVDELPQLWLVLKGEMSLVGPRPEQPGIVSDLEHRFPYYDRRHLVKPGITGWAQVRCGYAGSHIGSAWKLCHDLYYLKRRSALFDLLIMVETLSTVVVPEPINRPDGRFIVAMRQAGDDLPTSLEVT
jgi:lipopolysaccharide/colanic/teichoic acid biosynthesis glycosyltransferase